MALTLEKLHQHIEQKLPSAEQDFLKQFAAVLFEKATPDFLDEFDSESLLAMAVGALRRLEGKAPDQLMLRLFNPSYEADGWQSTHTAVELSLRDRPFIVDTVRAELKRQGLRIHYFLHPILHLSRDASGKLEKTLRKQDGSDKEAYELYFIDRLDDPERMAEVERRLHKVLDDVVMATDDYQAMKLQTNRCIEYLANLRQTSTDLQRSADLAECEAFLHWLTEGNFVFLGYREYDLIQENGEQVVKVDQSTCLGILRDISTSTYRDPVKVTELPESLRHRLTAGPLFVVTKTNAEATVHRSVRMDYVGMKKVGPNNEGLGEKRIVGLFTSQGLSTPVKEIPILRRKLLRVLDMDQALEGSHDFKQIVSIFNSMPREELFWADAESLYKDIRAIMATQRQHKVLLTLRPDPLSRGLQAMVIMPRDRFNSSVRNHIQELLMKRFKASHVDYQLSIGEEEDQARFHFFFITNERLQNLDMASLESEVADLTRTWVDRLAEKMIHQMGDTQGQKLAEVYANAFHEAYRSSTSLGLAVRDVENLEALFAGQDRFVVDFVNTMEDTLSVPSTQLRVYHPDEQLHLSDVLPILENLGLKILMQGNHDVKPRDRVDSSIDIFWVVDKRTKQPLDVRANRERLSAALVQLLSGKAENDKLNGLIMTTHVNLRQISLLRSFLVHNHQLQPANARHFLNEALLENPKVAQILVEFFEERFRPGALGMPERTARASKIKEQFYDSLNAVTSLAFDRILRDLFNQIESTVRSNYYLNKGHISHKVRCHLIKVMPEPRPLFEIVVVAPGVDGIHLRGGKVARGGLRWSDRPDFRTEVLGLMKTQMTKNAVIVPVGSKGGFALKNAPRERADLMVYVVEQYKTFIRGLLDLTDNLVGGRTVHPEGLVIYDEADPYLVVAADKGTATFSDIANGVSAEYGFWLGDAFASGGSQGYDHKKEGITARGAWEGVKRHFREMGVNVQEQETTVAGIGDLAGDVFGNGLIYCDTLRLQAAFNHLHIFLDPSPDAKRSFAERVRMFNLPRSSWEDYDKSLISDGGGVFERAAKSIPLSAQVKAMLMVEEDALSGEDLIKAIMRMPVDLLWNGGIGTYVKSSEERNTEVGDSSNDSVRVNATELRCKVVGEGGNQGFTQLGRIEYARRGGRINTDAIDNSAGVDMSDHEVNIKILLGPMVQNGDLTMEQRNSLLTEMTSEVNQLVLADNYFQTLSLSLSERRSKEALPIFISLMDYLAERGGLNKAVEFMPDAKTLAERQRLGEGLTRPELAILMAYTKMGLYRRILETDFPDEPFFQHYLLDYFPTALRERYADRIPKHSLRREIIATQFTNTVVNLLGMIFVHRKIQDTGASPIQVIRAALAALDIVESGEYVHTMVSLDNKVPSEAIYRAQRRMTIAIENVVNWMLLTDVDLSSLSDFIKSYKEPLSELRKNLDTILPAAQHQRWMDITGRLRQEGFPEEVLPLIASLEWVASGLGVIDTARRTGLSIADAAKRYYELGERFSLGWLRDHVRVLPARDKWEQIAIVGLEVELRRIQLQLVLSNQEFPSVDGGLVYRYDQALEEVKAHQSLSLSSGSVLLRMLNQMAQGSHSHDPRTLETLPVLPGVRQRRYSM